MASDPSTLLNMILKHPFLLILYIFTFLFLTVALYLIASTIIQLIKEQNSNLRWRNT